MAQKEIQVRLTFNTNTQAAKAQIAQLQQQLSNLAATPITGNTTVLTSQLQNAASKAVELKLALQNATNVNTGKLNFSKFSQELQKNKTSLQQYAMSLKQLGPQGTEAFVGLAKAIRQSETPLLSLKGKVADLGKTLMNTVKWQLSSTLIHGTMSAMSGVVNYAKELNESLNNIRIVTAKSQEEMAAFAKEANKAAKALSTTTTEYTNASLIYYQQGLNSSEVKERTETTIKLANVVGESAETVSEWMTAIWNNFDDGSQSLEYYADVLAKLGAATASSADEIAGGLEKFAAIANTVGLSYEYAASALATITAETRQSEDVVGTALKTIFARVENLKLGETLEDGTNLGQYSAALAKVGINIKDASGNLREMDSILDDIGTQWNTLNEAEQVALAQSVAGIRQYSQFLALMDNWDVMENNVELSKEANGELEQQLLIYQDGIEGSTARVKANLEEIKNTILDENDLIPLLNVADGFVTVVGDLLKALGGIPGLLAIISSWALKIYGPQAASALNSMVSQLAILKNTITGKAQQERSQAIVETQNTGANMAANTGYGQYGLSQSNILKDNAKIAEDLEKVEKNITLEKKQQLDLEYQLLELQQDVALQTAKEQEKSQAETEQLRGRLNVTLPKEAQSQLDNLQTSATLYGTAEGFETGTYTDTTQLMQHASDLQKQAITLNPDEKGSIGTAYNDLSEAVQNYDKKLQKVEETESKIQQLQSKKGKLTKQEQTDLKQAQKNQATYNAQLQKSKETLDAQKQSYTNSIKSVSKYEQQIQDLGNTYQDNRDDIVNFGESARNTAKLQEKSGIQLENVGKSAENFREKIKSAGEESQHWSQTVVNGIQTMASFAAGLNMLHSSFGSLTTMIANGEFSLSTFLSSMTSILFALPMMISGLQGLSKMIQITTWAQNLMNKAGEQDSLIKAIQITLSKKFGKAKKQESKEVVEAEGTERTATISTAIANVIKWITKGPTGWPNAILGLAALTIVGAAVIGISVSNKKQANQEEQNKENAQAELDEAKETTEANKELYDSYTELYDTYKKTGEGKEELASAAYKLAEAYNIEGAALAELSGNYDKLTKAATQARIEELNTLATAAEANIDVNSSDFEDVMRGGKGWKTSNDTYKAEFKAGNSISDEQEIIDAVNTLKEDPMLSKYLSYNDGIVTLETENMTPEEFARAYEAIQAIVNKARENGINTTESEIYNDMIAWMGKAKEQYEKYIENEDIKLQSQAESKILSTKSDKGLDVTEITDFDDYLSYRNKVLSGLEIGSKEYDTYLTALSSQENTGDFEVRAKSIEEQAKAQGNNEQFKKNLTTAYQNASETMVRALAMVEVSEGMTWDEFQEQAQYNLAEAAKGLKLDTAAKYQVSETQANTYTRVLKTYNEYLEDNVYLLEMASNAAIQLNGELKKLIETWNKNSSALFTADANTTEYAYALANISNGLATLIGTDADLTNVVHLNKNLIAEFMNGNLELFDDIQKLVAQEVASTYTDVENLDILFTMIGNKDYSFGENVDISGWEQQINTIISKSETGITAINAVLEAMGYLAEFEGTGTSAKLVGVTRIKDEDSIDKSLFEENEKAKKQRLKSIKDEIERYHEIKEVMEDLENEANRLADAKDRAFGADKLALMDQEIAKQEEILAKEKQYQKEIEDWYSTDRQNIINKYGASLDSSGRIINYDELRQVQLNALQNVAQDSEAYDKQKELFDEFEKDIEQYEETLNLLEDQQQAVIDKQNEMADLALEKIEYEVEIKVKVADNDIKYLDYLIKNLDDNAFAAAETIVLLGQKTEATFDKIDAYAKGIRETFAQTFSESEIQSILNGDLSVLEGKSLTENQINALEEYRDALYDTNEELDEIRDTIQNELVEAYEAWEEKIDDQMSKFDHFDNLLQSYKDIIDVIGKDNLGISDEVINKLTESQINNAQNRVQAITAQLEAEKAILADYQSKFVAATTEEDKKYWEDMIKQVQDNIDELEEEQLSSLSDTLQLLADQFEQTMNQVADSFSKSVSGIYGSLENMRETFDQQKELSGLYLADYKKLYEISKLNREINKSIDATDNVKAQRELQGLAEELNAYQKEGVEMSEYDLEYLQKKYDLKLAEIALEEAQDAKNQVRLTRDSEGNWGYVYTADQNTIADAQQKYEDAKFALDDLNHQREQELVDFWISMNEDYEASVRDLGEKYTEGSEEYNQQLALINEKYREKAAWALGEYKDLANNTGIAFNQTYLGKMYPDYTTFEGLHQGVTESIDATSQALNEAELDRSEKWEEALDSAGLSVDGLGDTVTEASGTIDKESTDAKDSVETMSSDMVSDIGDISTAVSSWQQNYGTQIGLIKASNDKLILSVNDVVNAYQQMTGWAKTATEEAKNALESYNKAKEAITGESINDDSLYDETSKIEIPETKKNLYSSIGTIDYYNSRGDFVTGGFDVEGDRKTKLIDNPTYTQNISKLVSIDKNKTWTSAEGNATAYYFQAKDLQGKIFGGYATLPQLLAFTSRFAPEENKFFLKDKTGGRLSNFVNSEGTDLPSGYLKSDKGVAPDDALSIIGTGISDNILHIKEKDGTADFYMTLEELKKHPIEFSSSSSLLKSILGFNTGGYTGSWGPEGKLAMLHQKELVLNAADTENMLSAVGILRSFSDRLEQNAAFMSRGLDLVNMAMTVPNFNTGTLEQQIQITAQFPNATDRNEIEQAFANLANRASQYANRKF